MAQNNNKKNMNKKFFFLVVVLISSLAALISMEYGKTVTDGKMSSSQNKSIRDFEYDAGSKADFAVFDENIFYCTKDGMQYVDSSGETLWNDTYNMTIPYMIQNKGVVGVCEHKGRVLLVYNTEGKLYSVQLSEPIVGFSVNGTGFSSVITSLKNEYQLEVYNSKGEKIFLGKFQLIQGIPVSTSISEDGNILAVGFLNITGVNVSSRVSFYDISPKNTQNAETNDAVFASFNEESSVCGVVSFFSGNLAAVVFDKSLVVLSVNPFENEKYTENGRVDFKNQIKQIAFDENSNIYAAFGDKLINSGNDALESGTVVCYNKDCVKKFEINTNRRVTGIYPNGNSVIIGMDRKFQNYTESGGFVWEYNTNQDTKKLLLLDEKELILFVAANKASIIKLNELSIQTEEVQAEVSVVAESETETVVSTEKQTEPSTKAVVSADTGGSVQQKNSAAKKNNENNTKKTNVDTPKVSENVPNNKEDNQKNAENSGTAGNGGTAVNNNVENSKTGGNKESGDTAEKPKQTNTAENNNAVNGENKTPEKEDIKLNVDENKDNSDKSEKVPVIDEDDIVAPE